VISDRRLYLCTPDRPDLDSFVAAAVRGGVDIVQLRERALSDRELIERARTLREICREHGVPFIVNDRPDVALEVGADGVHVGQDDVPPSLARRILGPDAIVGLSTHAPSELEAAADEPVDYLSAGPVEPTPTKPGRPGTGIRYASLATARARRPVFVTGGVRPDRVADLVHAGVRHFVVVRYLTEASDPEAAARRLRTAIDAAIDAAVAGTDDAAITGGGDAPSAGAPASP